MVKGELKVFIGMRDLFNSLTQLNLIYILTKFVQVRVQSKPTRSNLKRFGSSNEFIILNT
jgi:hypothetical protein